MFFKIGTLKNITVSTRNTCVGVSFKNVAGLPAALLKTDSKEVFSYEYCKKF